MKFTKMHGAGNDYIYVNCIDGTFGGDDAEIISDDARLADIARRLSRPHFGIGADGLVMILPSDVADMRMRMFNADGSEGRMCGNATRCIGKLAHDNSIIGKDKTSLALETASGVKYLTLFVGDDGLVKEVTVDMGAPVLSAGEVPVVLPDGCDPYAVPASACGDEFVITPVSMGNPHGVVFVDEITDRLVLAVGPQLEVHPMWPDRANIEFARLNPDGSIDMRVWERGSGETLACGTGACATAVAAMLTGRTSAGKVTIHLIGGDLTVAWDGTPSGHVMMTGPATTVFTGDVTL